MIREQSMRQVEVSRESRAYRSGWEDGRFGAQELLVTSPNLSAWTDTDRLAYYQGHREGRRIRNMLQDTARFA